MPITETGREATEVAVSATVHRYPVRARAPHVDHSPVMNVAVVRAVEVVYNRQATIKSHGGS
jgi:hypothetical protein